MKKKLAVCVVGDFRYLYKYFYNFKTRLRENGRYFGEIIIITSPLCPTFLIPSIYDKNVSILRFQKIKFSKLTEQTLNSNDSNGQPNRNLNKPFQWHKLNLFDKKLKKWDYIFYLDINMFIHGNLSKLLNNVPSNKLLARADTFPEYSKTLSTQFDKNSESYKKLENEYDLTITNYFQTGLLFYHTNIINKDTKKTLIDLARKFPCTTTNEQAICNLYFIFQRNVYQELPTKIENKIPYFYWKHDQEDVLITKQNRTQYK
jgi:hypothetical protein